MELNRSLIFTMRVNITGMPEGHVLDMRKKICSNGPRAADWNWMMVKLKMSFMQSGSYRLCRRTIKRYVTERLVILKKIRNGCAMPSSGVEVFLSVLECWRPAAARLLPSG